MKPKSLVTDAAIDAGERARDASPPHTDALAPVLTATAPLIAAEALRQAILRAEGDFYETWGYVDESADSVLEGLRQRVEELERE